MSNLYDLYNSAIAKVASQYERASLTILNKHRVIIINNTEQYLNRLPELKHFGHSKQLEKQLINTSIVNLSDLIADLHKLLSRYNAKIAVLGITKAFADLNATEIPVLPNEVKFSIAHYADATAQSIADTEVNLIHSILDKHLVQRSSIQEITDDLNAKIKSFSKAKARQTAITETTTASNNGILAGYQEQQVEKKRWLSHRDGSVRDDHINADGQVVGIDDYFSIGGEVCKFPGEFSLSPKQRVNCRCSITVAS